MNLEQKWERYDALQLMKEEEWWVGESQELVTDLLSNKKENWHSTERIGYEDWILGFKSKQPGIAITLTPRHKFKCPEQALIVYNYFKKLLNNRLHIKTVERDDGKQLFLKNMGVLEGVISGKRLHWHAWIVVPKKFEKKIVNLKIIILKCWNLACWRYSHKIKNFSDFAVEGKSSDKELMSARTRISFNELMEIRSTIWEMGNIEFVDIFDTDGWVNYMTKEMKGNGTIPFRDSFTLAEKE